MYTNFQGVHQDRLSYADISSHGLAVIDFAGGDTVKDTLKIVLSTFMPAVCKDVKPEVWITTLGGKRNAPFASARLGDVFTFMFYFDKSTIIQSIHLTGIKFWEVQRMTGHCLFLLKVG